MEKVKMYAQLLHFVLRHAPKNWAYLLAEKLPSEINFKANVVEIDPWWLCACVRVCKYKMVREKIPKAFLGKLDFEIFK